MGTSDRRMTKALAASLLAAVALIAGGTSALAAHASSRSSRAAGAFTTRVFATGNHILHATRKGKVAISQPDDITYLGGHIFVGFQNGIGPQGQASTTGNRDSTVVEFNLHGHAVDQWDVVGKCDGVTADPLDGQVIATVNEDANSSIYLIDPGGKAVHYRYNVPLPSHGGTDAIEVYHGLILLSASAPGTTGAAAPQPSYPAVYRATFTARTHVATVKTLFGDEAFATVANTNSAQRGKRVRLALTDPDSNEDVPSYADRFAGDFMLTSQGDKEQIFVLRKGRLGSHLAVLQLSQSVDDTAWARSAAGRLYAASTADGTVDVVSGPFRPGTVLVAVTPCDADNAPATCPAPGFPPNYLGQLNPWTGLITRVPVRGADLGPQGMVFVAPGWNVTPG